MAAVDAAGAPELSNERNEAVADVIAVVIAQAVSAVDNSDVAEDVERERGEKVADSTEKVISQPVSVVSNSNAAEDVERSEKVADSTEKVISQPVSVVSNSNVAEDVERSEKVADSTEKVISQPVSVVSNSNVAEDVERSEKVAYSTEKVISQPVSVVSNSNVAEDVERSEKVADSTEEVILPPVSIADDTSPRCPASDGEQTLADIAVGVTASDSSSESFEVRKKPLDDVAIVNSEEVKVAAQLEPSVVSPKVYQTDATDVSNHDGDAVQSGSIDSSASGSTVASAAAAVQPMDLDKDSLPGADISSPAVSATPEENSKPAKNADIVSVLDATRMGNDAVDSGAAVNGDYSTALGQCDEGDRNATTAGVSDATTLADGDGDDMSSVGVMTSADFVENKIEELCFGTPLEELCVCDDPPNCRQNLNPSMYHAVLFDVDTLHLAEPPFPFPDDFSPERDKVDYHHVLLPYSQYEGGQWKHIEAALGTPFTSLQEMADAIHSYSDTRRGMDFTGLQLYVSTRRGFNEANCDLLDLINKIAALALEMPKICTQPIPILNKGWDASITLSQKQAACILANAFFCTFPWRRSSCVHLTFANLFQEPSYRREDAQYAKLDCLFNYFRRVFEEMPRGCITFHRQVIQENVDWKRSPIKLQKHLRVSVSGRLPDDARGMLHVDFANKFVGGGMLGEGCVQEEILFMLYPELIVSRLFTEELNPKETLIVTGCERFNDSEGYASSFRWVSNHDDTGNRDMWSRRPFEVVAMDALELWGYSSSSAEQLHQNNMLRELNKAYCGFSDSVLHQCHPPTTVATGNWGCGAFGGNPYVKALIQLMAASQAGRGMYYFTFDDCTLAESLSKVHKAMTDAGWSVGDLFNCLSEIADDYTDEPFDIVGYDHIIEHCKHSSVMETSV